MVWGYVVTGMTLCILHSAVLPTSETKCADDTSGYRQRVAVWSIQLFAVLGDNLDGLRVHLLGFGHRQHEDAMLNLRLRLVRFVLWGALALQARALGARLSGRRCQR
jgi:hypothetical protein